VFIIFDSQCITIFRDGAVKNIKTENGSKA